MQYLLKQHACNEDIGCKIYDKITRYNRYILIIRSIEVSLQSIYNFMRNKSYPFSLKCSANFKC